MKRNRIFWLALVPVVVAAWLLAAPPRWWLNVTKPVDLNQPVRAGAALVDGYNCRRCHRIDGRGALTAADLDQVTERLDSDAIRLWLRDPKQVRPDTAMPHLRLSDPEIEAILAYLNDL
jgi:cytochrome c2